MARSAFVQKVAYLAPIPHRRSQADMPIDTELHYGSVGQLFLDPRNPRLGRRNTEKGLSQPAILELMKDWTLDELAVSFLENGFWPQEALMVVREPIDGRVELVVVEGNRRLAALKYLFAARAGNPVSRKWSELAASGTEEQFKRLERIAYLEADKRTDVERYLGFRHVTGIKQWNPAEKAEYIAHLIDERRMSYREVMRTIGSKTPTVRQNYITYRLLLQMEGAEDRIAVERVEEKFSVLYLSLRTTGVRQFLQIDIEAEPGAARKPVPQDKLENLVDFARWLFGDDKSEPVVSDSRQVDRFGKILEVPEAVEYLRNSDSPNIETAYRRTGGEESDVRLMVERATYAVEEALSSAHRHRDAETLVRAVRRFAQDALQLIRIFPGVESEILGARV